MDGDAGSTRRRLLGTGVGLLAGLAGCLGGGSGGGSGTDDGTEGGNGDDPTTEATPTTGAGTTTGEPIESRPLPNTGAEEYVEQVESFESQGNAHVSPDTDPDYARIPPTSGPHYNSVVDPGFYTERKPLGSLVHNLEHGAVVVYYDPAAITPAARESLEAFAAAHTDPWAHVVVVPSPTDSPAAPYVLTAWRKRFRLDAYDARAVRAFLAEFLGRGPENPVR